MMLTEVSLGFGKALRLGTVGISLLLREGTVIVGAEGLMGMAAMLWWRYQAKTDWGGEGIVSESQRIVPFVPGERRAKRKKIVCGTEDERKNGWAMNTVMMSIRRAYFCDRTFGCWNLLRRRR